MRRARTLLAVMTLVALGCAPCETTVGNVCLVVGTGELGFNRDGLVPEETDLFLVSAARVGPDARLYIMDFNNQRLRRIAEDDTVETVIGNGFHAIANVELPALDSPLENPIDFDFLSDGRLVFVSYHDPRVLALDSTGALQTIAGAADGVIAIEGNEGDGGPASEALFIQLDGIAVTADDAIYVSDSLANRVRLIRDGVIRTVVGTGAAAYTGDGGPGEEAALSWPTALELDPEGNLFIADTFNHAIRRLAIDGTITTVGGTGVAGSAGDGGPATDAQLSQPMGLAVEADGTLYISDRGNHKIRRVTPEGAIETLAGLGEEGASGDGGPASEATFGYTARIALDGDGLLVADQSNSTVRRITLR